MAWTQRSQQGIGRGEVAEGQADIPLFILFMTLAAAGLLVLQVVLGNTAVTVAAAVSMLVFGATVVRVEYGLYILLVAMLLSPEIEAGSVGTHDELGVNLRYDDVLVIVIFLGVMLKHAFEGRPLMWRPSPINAGITGYYGLCLVSSLLALRLSVPAWDRDVAFFTLLKMLEYYLIFFMVGMSITSMDDVRRQLTVFFAVSLIVCVYGIVSIGTQPRVSAPFEAGGTEPNTFGGYLLIVMCTALSLAFFAPRRDLRLLLYTITGIASVPFVMTLSRASYASLFVALILLGWMGRRYWIWGLIAVALIGAPILFPDVVIKRVQSTFEPSGVAVDVPVVGSEVLIDKSAYERVYVWQKVRHNLKVWPFFGGGVSWDTVLDSQFARVIIETGLFGLAAFLFLLWRLIRTSRETYRWSRDWVAKSLGLAMCVNTLALMVHSFGTISFLIVRMMEPFWFLMALVVVSRQIALLDHAERARALADAQSAHPASGPLAQTA
jgi:hypothetical protein